MTSSPETERERAELLAQLERERYAQPVRTDRPLVEPPGAGRARLRALIREHDGRA